MFSSSPSAGRCPTPSASRGWTTAPTRSAPISRRAWQRLGVDHVDLLQIHDIDRETPIEESWATAVAGRRGQGALGRALESHGRAGRARASRRAGHLVPGAAQPAGRARRSTRPIDERTAVTLALRNNPDYRGRSSTSSKPSKTCSRRRPIPVHLRRQCRVHSQRNAEPRRQRQRALERLSDVQRRHGTPPPGFRTALKRRFESTERASKTTWTRTFPGERPGVHLHGVVGRAAVIQPLMRGFGTTVGEVGLRSARVSRTIAEKNHRRLTSQLVRDVLGAYWELWFATESVQIEQAALDLAKRQEEEANARGQDRGAFAGGTAHLSDARGSARRIGGRGRRHQATAQPGSGPADRIVRRKHPAVRRRHSATERRLALQREPTSKPRCVPDSIELAELEARCAWHAPTRKPPARATGRGSISEGFVESRGRERTRAARLRARRTDGLDHGWRDATLRAAARQHAAQRRAHQRPTRGAGSGDQPESRARAQSWPTPRSP